MDLKDILLNEISQTEEDRYCMTSLTCGICNSSNRTSSWAERTHGCGQRHGWRGHKEKGKKDGGPKIQGTHSMHESRCLQGPSLTTQGKMTLAWRRDPRTFPAAQWAGSRWHTAEPRATSLVPTQPATRLDEAEEDGRVNTTPHRVYMACSRLCYVPSSNHHFPFAFWYLNEADSINFVFELFNLA